ncbi:uncharacterized protein LOC120887589 [Ictidomys tridecemlineatus]
MSALAVNFPSRSNPPGVADSREHAGRLCSPEPEVPTGLPGDATAQARGAAPAPRRPPRGAQGLQRRLGVCAASHSTPTTRTPRLSCLPPAHRTRVLNKLLKEESCVVFPLLARGRNNWWPVWGRIFLEPGIQNFQQPGWYTGKVSQNRMEPLWVPERLVWKVPQAPSGRKNEDEQDEVLDASPDGDRT